MDNQLLYSLHKNVMCPLRLTKAKVLPPSLCVLGVMWWVLCGVDCVCMCDVVGVVWCGLCVHV